VSSTAPAAVPGSIVVSDPGARVTGGWSAAWAETVNNEAANRRSTAQHILFLSRVVFIVTPFFDGNIANKLPSVI
jgi:hypothetical protein